MAPVSLNSAYTYYLSTYGNRASTRYDTHKKSELRNIYNRIVKLNKDSPLYKIRTDSEVAKFAIDVKEGAQSIRNVVSSLSDSDDIMKAFQKKIAISSQADVVTAKYTGHSMDSDVSENFDVEVRQLASPQINIGNFLSSNGRDLIPGSYSFDLTNTSTAYEFQFNVNETDTNFDIQEKLSNLISNANIGLTASVLEDEQGRSALRIESLNTGADEQDIYQFRITAEGNSNSITAMHVLGLDQVSQNPQNSVFLLNGTERSSFSNTFTINQIFELTLKGISPEGSPATIGFKANVDTVADNIQTLVDSYNHILKTAYHYSERQPNSYKLMQQMSSAAKNYRNELEPLGLNQDKEGFISIDRSLLADAVNTEEPAETFSVLNDFKNALDERASTAVLNPMEYVNKIMVAYKNPGRNFATPYITSIYSGMMMDRYC